HRIEHVQLVHPDDVGSPGALQIIGTMQPTPATSAGKMCDSSRSARAGLGYNARVLEDASAVLAFGSDAPVESFDARMGIDAAVTRRRPDGSPGPDGWYPEQRLDVDTTLRAYTQGPAYAAGLERALGMLAPGFLADLVMLDRDLFALPPDELLTVRVLGTMVGGVWRSRASD